MDDQNNAEIEFTIAGVCRQTRLQIPFKPQAGDRLAVDAGEATIHLVITDAEWYQSGIWYLQAEYRGDWTEDEEEGMRNNPKWILQPIGESS